jgi:hypothetical protein
MRMGRTDGLAPSVPDRKPPNRPPVLRRFHVVVISGPVWIVAASRLASRPPIA